jgi:hypothetical protein
LTYGAQGEGDEADDHEPERLDADRNSGKATDPHAAEGHQSEVRGLMWAMVRRLPAKMHRGIAILWLWCSPDAMLPVRA